MLFSSYTLSHELTSIRALTLRLILFGSASPQMDLNHRPFAHQTKALNQTELYGGVSQLPGRAMPIVSGYTHARTFVKLWRLGSNQRGTKLTVSRNYQQLPHQNAQVKLPGSHMPIVSGCEYARTTSLLSCTIPVIP